MKVLVAGGASGGHIFPALAFIDELRRRCPAAQVRLVVPPTRQQLNAALSGYAPLRLPAVPAADGWRGLPRFLLAAVFAVFRSFLLVARFQPDCVVGFGSVSSAALVLCGWLLRSRTVIHEQNVVPGKATRLLSLCAGTVCLSFDQTRRLLPWAARRCVVTGNPLRASLSPVDRGAALAFFSLDPSVLTVLVMGGSQGSATINRHVPEALAAVRRPGGVQVIHLAGSEEEAGLVRARYAQCGIRCHVRAFLEPMHYAYSCADLAVSRAGATSVAELIRFACPAVLIPYPFANRHQFYNARVLADCGCASIVEDAAAGRQLAGVLARLLDDPSCLRAMRAGFGRWAGRSSTERFTDEVLHG